MTFRATDDKIPNTSATEDFRMALAATVRHRLVLASLAGLLLVGAATGGLVWAATRCDRGAYLGRASVSWVNNQEEYLFACGQVWHSLNAGQTWTPIHSGGLPWLLRDGRIAEDRTVGRLYLAVTLAVPTSFQCLLCPFTEVQPAIYLSEDGGHHWRLTGLFPGGPTGFTDFRSISADPDYGDAGWVVVARGEQVAYYATNTGGQQWRLTCEERLGYFCDPPSDFLAARHARPDGQP
jgi:photosystem II stability/assembly factor-like uncharacterized protein